MSSPEIVDFGPTVDAIGNHPAKMATLLLFAEQPDVALGKSQLGAEFMRMQGDEPGWELTKGGRGTPFSYCERGVAPELLTETQIPSLRSSGRVKAYQINEQGLTTGVPLSGAGLGWELDHDDTSSAYLLGYTSSNARSDRMPSLRLKIYEHLLASPEGMSRTQLQQAVGETAARFMQLVPNLRDAGIVDILERYNPAHRTVVLSAPDFTNLKRGGPRVHPETHAIFDVVNELVSSGQTRMTGQELLDEISSRYPRFDPMTVWKRLTIARASHKMRFVDVEAFEADDEQHTNVVIADDFKTPISAMVESVVRLGTDEAYRAAMEVQAREIIRDPVLVAELMAKARGNSAYTDPLYRQEWHRLVMDRVPTEGIDARSLYNSIRPVSPPISYTQFRRILTELDGQGYDISWGEAQGRQRRVIGRVSLQ